MGTSVAIPMVRSAIIFVKVRELSSEIFDDYLSEIGNFLRLFLTIFSQRPGRFSSPFRYIERLVRSLVYLPFLINAFGRIFS